MLTLLKPNWIECIFTYSIINSHLLFRFLQTKHTIQITATATETVPEIAPITFTILEDEEGFSEIAALHERRNLKLENIKLCFSNN